MLSCLLAILHVCDLCGCLTAPLPHPLDSSNNLLVVLASLSRLVCPLPFRFVDLELKHSVIRASSASVRASSNRSVGFVV